MESRLLQKLVNKSMTKEEVLQKIYHNFDLIPEVVEGVSSPKATIRYGCSKVLIDLSEKHPERLYPYMDFFTSLLDSKYRILKWNTMAVIANLACVDKDKKFDAIFNKYYSFMNDPYMVTVASVVGHSSKIAVAKPYLIQKITNELLKVENITTTPHLTEECKRVITEKTIESFDKFLDQINNKGQVISFVERNVDSPRETLRHVAQNFIAKWGE
jgi:hypothetical protein